MANRKSKTKDITDEQEVEKNFPSVNLAYEIAIDSYELLIKRIDAVDTRLQTMQAFSLSLLVAIPTFAKLREISFDSIYFALGVYFLVCSIAIAFYARFAGKVRMIVVEKVRNEYLHLSEFDFKNAIICWAVDDQKDNAKLLSKLKTLSIVAVIMFFLSMALLALWLAYYRD